MFLFDTILMQMMLIKVLFLNFAVFSYFNFYYVVAYKYLQSTEKSNFDIECYNTL